MCKFGFIIAVVLSLGLVNTASAFDAKSKALLEKFCFDCHSDGVDKGNFEFDKIMSQPLNSKATEKNWHKIWEVIEEHQMPPADKKKQPTQAEREAMMVALEENVFSIDRKKRYAAPIHLTRLSNEQYARTIRTLSGSNLNVSQQLPLDPTSAGFSNIGSTLNISPMLFERYEKIALQVSRAMFIKNPKDSGAFKKGSDILKKSGDGKDLTKVEQTLVAFATDAFRRPLDTTESKEIIDLYVSLSKTLSHSDALMESLRSIMVSPNFIFRTELLGKDKVEGSLARIDEYALASRLSYFLWNSPPDWKLLGLAKKGKLRENLDKEISRLIKHKNFRYMTKSFGEYWLGIQYIDNNRPNRQVFKGFNTELLRKMGNETVSFLKYLFQGNRPINDMFSSNITFLDGSLAKFYKVKYNGKKGYVKTEMPASHNRRGILSQPSILIVTSDPDRTSPVKRGMWILETLLGMPPPPAPANVGGIEEGKKEGKELTFRQQLEKHREDKACASCHAMMDPLGFAMENFDGIGRWRTEDHGKPLDITTEWRGHKIKTFDDLYKILTEDYRDEFIACFTEKLMTYALGRALEIEDRIAVMDIVKKSSGKESTYQDIIKAIVESTPFQFRTLDREEAAK
ncbi:MAG: DUF1588 domain-containing protein [Lentisphaeraceae bacterium]|nr:DUF1588 domain-containing protein [Lentisphaeraceae bacterium]